MSKLLVTLNREEIEIEKVVFEDLLNFSHIKELKIYDNTIDSGKITFLKLKEIALRAGVPYPLFFAPKSIVDFQIENKNKNLFQKIPSKDEIRLNCRGLVSVADIELIALDLGRKQEFLKRRILSKCVENGYIGSLGRSVSQGASVIEVANLVRNYFEFDLSFIRNVPKHKVLAYLVRAIEAKNILVSFSSYNYMPQNLNKDLELSGMCIRDKKFPYIFINTRDGDEKPKIIESEGRQIFTLLTMIASIGIGQFFLSTKASRTKKDISKISYRIAAEIILPKSDIKSVEIRNLEELKEIAHFFRVTPSMLLYRLREVGRISSDLAGTFQSQLKNEVEKAGVKRRNRPLATTGYGKYNGERFSREVVKAFRNNQINEPEMKSILFRKSGKADPTLLNDYQKKYGGL